MLNIENLTDLKLDFTTLFKIVNRLTLREVELIICDNERIRDFNLEFRGKDAPTDVLSFPIATEVENLPLGSIVISANKIEEGAKEFNHSKEDELALLFIHGLLHLLGFDHEVDSGQMREKEKELIREFNLPESLIVRVER
jgi:probable rRNA maturation factor